MEKMRRLFGSETHGDRFRAHSHESENGQGYKRAHELSGVLIKVRSTCFRSQDKDQASVFWKIVSAI